jgi:hypothetical protein
VCGTPQRKLELGAHVQKTAFESRPRTVAGQQTVDTGFGGSIPSNVRLIAAA